MGTPRTDYVGIFSDVKKKCTLLCPKLVFNSKSSSNHTNIDPFSLAMSKLAMHTTHRYCLVIKISRAISNLLTYTMHRLCRIFFRYQVNMYPNLAQNWFSILGLLI